MVVPGVWGESLKMLWGDLNHSLNYDFVSNAAEW